ncbi:MAG: FixH family protein [Bacteriovorax sp.]|nr:FixH family protein [Bacteriovorax sp.]
MKKINCLLIFLVLVFTSCGKSPLLKELSKETGNIQAMESIRSFNTTSQSIQLNWITGINTNEEGKAIIILTKNGAVYDDSNYSLGAYLWMKSMGHGSSPIVVTKLTNGVYQLSELYFSMTGDWQLHLTLNKNNLIVEDVEYSYSLTL